MDSFWENDNEETDISEHQTDNKRDTLQHKHNCRRKPSSEETTEILLNYSNFKKFLYNSKAK